MDESIIRDVFDRHADALTDLQKISLKHMQLAVDADKATPSKIPKTSINAAPKWDSTPSKNTWPKWKN